jgi:type I restriction enzyme S subunit
MEDTKKVPLLRFPEFSGDWEVRKLKKIASKINSKNRNCTLTNVLTNSAIQGIINQDDYFDRDIANKNNLGGYYIVDINDFVYNPRISSNALVGSLKKNNNVKGVMSPLYTVFRFKKGVLSFFEQYFETVHWHRYMKNIANTGARHDRLNITNDSFFDLPLPYPFMAEQQKIAGFLTKIDNKIEQLSKKKQLLENYNKGVMQKIFSQELMFKDDEGNSYPDWEEKKLGEVGNFKSGTGFPEKEQGGKEGVPFYKVSDMNLPLNTTEMIEANHYVSDEQIKRMNLNVIKNKSIVFAKVGAAVFLERKRKSCDFLIDNNMMAFTPKEANINFIKFLFDTIRLSKYAQIGALPSYNGSDLKTIKINFPQIQEQIKIANFLTEIDKKINLVKKQLTDSKQYKKSLFQQMFI